MAWKWFKASESEEGRRNEEGRKKNEASLLSKIKGKNKKKISCWFNLIFCVKI